MNKTIFLAFDFGMKGDYEGLYRWLDEHHAEERGYGLAFIKNYDMPNVIKPVKSKGGKENDIALAQYLKNEISEYVNIGKGDRIYLIFRSFRTSKIIGTFLFGNKRQAPWAGYAQKDNNISDFDID